MYTSFINFVLYYLASASIKSNLNFEHMHMILD